MASYLVLTPPGARRNDENTRFIADGFAWTAFVFPGLWLLAKRQWIAGFVIVALQIAVTVLMSDPRLFPASFLIELALRLLVALEGAAFVANRLQAAGWSLQALIVADDLATAEDIFDSQIAEVTETDDWKPPLLPERSGGQSPSFGLFENYGER